MLLPGGASLGIFGCEVGTNLGVGLTLFTVSAMSGHECIGPDSIALSLAFSEGSEQKALCEVLFFTCTSTNIERKLTMNTNQRSNDSLDHFPIRPVRKSLSLPRTSFADELPNKEGKEVDVLDQLVRQVTEKQPSTQRVEKTIDYLDTCNQSSSSSSSSTSAFNLESSEALPRHVSPQKTISDKALTTPPPRRNVYPLPLILGSDPTTTPPRSTLNTFASARLRSSFCSRSCPQKKRRSVLKKKIRKPENSGGRALHSLHSFGSVMLDDDSRRNQDSHSNSSYDQTLDPDDSAREFVSIHDDVYNLFFLCSLRGHAFVYSFYVFVLKMALYTFLAVDVMRHVSGDLESDTLVAMAQFFMLPVAVAMQDDLTATYYLVANIKYDDSIRKQHPHALRWKFNVATACRFFDGLYSLLVNFVVMIYAETVLSLFLNFAALQFLQTIDNIALDLAADGYLSDRLETAAVSVQNASLPKRSESNKLRALDTVLFVGTVGVLFIIWFLLSFL